MDTRTTRLMAAPVSSNTGTCAFHRTLPVMFILSQTDAVKPDADARASKLCRAPKTRTLGLRCMQPRPDYYSVKMCDPHTSSSDINVRKLTKNAALQM